MKEKARSLMSLNLRTRGWGLYLEGGDLFLAAIHNRWNRSEFRAQERLQDISAKTDEEIQDFVEDFLAKNHSRRGDAFLVLPRSAVMIQILELPNEAADSLDEVVSYQVGNYFPGDMEQFEFFSQIVSRTDQLKVWVIAVNKEFLGQAFALLRKTGIKLAGMTLATLATANGIIHSGNGKLADKKLVVLNFLAKGLELISIQQGKLSASIYCDFEPEGDPQELIGTLENAFSAMRLDPNDVDSFYWAGRVPEQTKGYLTEELGIPYAEWEDQANHSVPPEALACFGAALTALVDKPLYNLNMLPEKLRKRHKQLPLILAAVMLMGFLGYFGYDEFLIYRDLSQEQQQVRAQLEKVRAKVFENAEARKVLEEHQANLLLYEPHRHGNVVLYLLQRMAQDLPLDTQISSIQINPDRRITIQGESEDPFQAQRIVSNFPFLKDVQPSNAITGGREAGKKRFMFNATLVLEAIP